jgi:hypothetical protein
MNYAQHNVTGYYAECCFAECRYEEFCYAECSYAECCYSESCYADRRGVKNGEWAYNKKLFTLVNNPSVQ